MPFWGDVLDNVGTALNLPEFGYSEGANGGTSVNTGRIAPTVNGLLNSSSSKGVQSVNNARANNAQNSGNSLGISGISLFGNTGQVNDPNNLERNTVDRLTGTPTYDQAAIQYYNDQEAQARQAIARLNAQRGIGLGNIQGAYQSAYDTLLGNNAQAERDAGLTRQRTIDDNVTARANVDQTVGRQAQGLRRLLGNSSSAAQFAAPLAVARQGNQQQGAIQTTFGRNLQNIDIADDDRKKAFGSAQEDLTRQRTMQENTLNSGLLNTEAQLNESLSGIALQRAQAQGQNYAQARGALTPYNDRVSSLLSQIDQLGANPSIAARNVNFTAPTLDAYNTSGIAVGQGQNPAQAQAGQYANLLNLEDRKKRNLF